MMDEDSAGFGELLQQAEQLTAEIDDTGLPRVARNLKQIVEEGQQLWARTAQLAAKDTNEVKASILLGSRGIDLPKISQRLEGLAAAPTFETVEEAHETDIQAFLRNERENAVLSVFADSLKATQEEVDKFCWDTFSNEWQREKQRILDSLLGPSNDVMDVRDVSMGPEMGTSSLNLDLKTRSKMTATEVPYAREVEQYNEQVIKGGLRPKLAERFKAVAKELDDRSAMEAWDMVCSLVEAPLSGEGAVPRTAALVLQSRAYLERTYGQFMRVVIEGNRGQAALGGEPGTLSLVKSFLNVKRPSLPPEQHDGTLAGQSVWALIYYCLRCGDRQAAVELTPIFEEYAASEDGHLSASSENRVRQQYARSVRTPDARCPFKRAVFCILGRCDVAQDHPEVTTTCEDYLWLKLCLVYVEEPAPGEEHQEQARDRLTLSKLQYSLLEEEPLKASASVQLPLVSKAPAGHGYRFNLARLVTSYTRNFELTDPCKALGYYYFLRNLKGSRGEDLFVACVSELVMQTKEFTVLLGKIEPDGCRRQGAVDQYRYDTKRIIEAVAEDCESRGLYEEAVGLYDLCEKHDNAIKLLNRLLAQHVPSACGPVWNRLQSLATDLAQRYRNHGCEASPETLSALYLLLDLGTFFQLANQNKAVLALDVIRKLDLIPFQPSMVDASVAAFSRRSEEVRRILADVLLAVMNLLYGQYKELKGPEESRRQELRSQARAIITFSGSIPYRMPGDTNARLVQMEVLMS
ncbi:hypothetical protein HPB48_008553 [Haemaphysalis longicornis]|uniref:Nuclear pore protein n=1 Tax=Haemaphysalis longicornis TaxID=44386 RepID=A0A9J6GJS6_HAELO|nr:hypothetical protein HPB48_008553 [Haemaphysalis longicornis]